LRCPQAGQSAAYFAASSSITSTAGVGHGPFPAGSPDRCRASLRWQVRRGMPVIWQNPGHRHRRVLAYHLKVREGARRPSADFFRTRSPA
jgi:hypothetical protein